LEYTLTVEKGKLMSFRRGRLARDGWWRILQRKQIHSSVRVSKRQGITGSLKTKSIAFSMVWSIYKDLHL